MKELYKDFIMVIYIVLILSLVATTIMIFISDANIVADTASRSSNPFEILFYVVIYTPLSIFFNVFIHYIAIRIIKSLERRNES